MNEPWERDWSQPLPPPWERKWTNVAPAAPDAPETDPVKAFAIAAGRRIDRTASGLRALTPDPIRNAVDSLNSKLGLGAPPTIDPTQIANNEQAYAPLEKSNPVSTFLGDMAPQMVTGNPLAMAGMAGLEYGTPMERATRAGMAFAGGKAGQYVGGKMADMAGKRAAENAAMRAAAPVDDSALAATKKAAMDAGYVFPPDQINPTPLNRVLTGMSGKISTQQGAAIKNEPLTLAIAKADLGLPESVPLTKQSIAAVRKTAGQAYEQMKSFGRMETGKEYGPAVDGMWSEYRSLVAELPELANPKIDGLIDLMHKMQRRGEINSSTAVELVKRLRSDAKANLKAFDDPEKLALGRMQNQAQQIIEDMMDRNLAASGNDGFLQVFRNARTLIAKAHTVEDALEESTGKVLASKIKGKNLTGGLKLIAQTHEAFPKSLQNINTPMPGVSPLDFMGGILGGSAGGLGVGMGIPFVRPLVRAGILSKPYQNSLGVGGGKEADLLELLAKNPDIMKRLGGLLGLGAPQAFQ